ncbi:hypothetical protein, partial [Acidiphilium sp. 37-64-53]|uniref:hypothetical protein n=1 Tax=Acidiphilium sp. 37-64-53 TaxID=1970299 RepID=UPI00257F386E
MKIAAFADNPFLARMAGAPIRGLGGVRAIEFDDPKSGSWISYGPERRLDFQRLVVAQPGLNRSG